MVVGRLADRPITSTYHVTSHGRDNAIAIKITIKISVIITAALSDLYLSIMLTPKSLYIYNTPIATICK